MIYKMIEMRINKKKIDKLTCFYWSRTDDNYIQWNLFKPTSLGPRRSIDNTAPCWDQLFEGWDVQVFGLYRLNQQLFPSLGLWLQFGLWSLNCILWCPSDCSNILASNPKRKFASGLASTFCLPYYFTECWS